LSDTKNTHISHEIEFNQGKLSVLKQFQEDSNIKLKLIFNESVKSIHNESIKAEVYNPENLCMMYKGHYRSNKRSGTGTEYSSTGIP